MRVSFVYFDALVIFFYITAIDIRLSIVDPEVSAYELKKFINEGAEQVTLVTIND